MGVGGLLPLQEVGPSIFRWDSRRRLPNRDGERVMATETQLAQTKKFEPEAAVFLVVPFF